MRALRLSLPGLNCRRKRQWHLSLHAVSLFQQCARSGELLGLSIVATVACAGAIKRRAHMTRDTYDPPAVAADGLPVLAPEVKRKFDQIKQSKRFLS
jgi:hypothetical protein